MSLSFWKKLSTYSTIITGTLLVGDMFFSKYTGGILLRAFPFTIIPMLTFMIAEVMKYKVTHKKNE